MKGLLVKDWAHIRITFLGLLPYLFFMTAMSAVSAFGNGGIAFVAVPGIAVFQAILPAVIIMDDNRTGFDKMVLTMPVDRKSVVAEKYVLALGNSLFCGIFFTAVTAAAAILGGNSVLPSVSGGMLMVVCSLFTAVVMLPMMFLVSTEQMKAAYIGGLLFFGSITGMVIAFMKLSGRSLKNFSVSIEVSSVLMTVMLALTAVSYFISLHFYTKKDI